MSRHSATDTVISRRIDRRWLGLAGLCWLICLIAGATSAYAVGDVKVTYQGHMVSFRTTGSKEALFGHYMIEINWTETASVDSSSLTEHNLKEIALPPLDWTLQSLTGKVHEDQLGDPIPPEKECTASFSPRPGFSEQVDYSAGIASTSNLLTLKAKAPFTVGSFMSSIEEESSFCSASAVHIDGKQAVAPPESDAAAYAEYLAAYEPSLTVPIDETEHTAAFDYSYTFENPPKLAGEQAYVTVTSSISVDSRRETSALKIEFPDGKPIEPVSPIPLIEPPPYYSSHHYPPGTGAKGGAGGKEETPPLELEPVSGAVKGWKLRCPTTLPRCQAKAVLTAVLTKAGRGRVAGRPSKRMVIGGATISVVGGHSDGIDIRLTRKGLALLRARRRLRCTLTITATAPGLVKPVSGSWALELKWPRGRSRRGQD
jgi:hypothetical protein